ncbi:MAG: TonB-dependent receptor [Bacteroidales bacterium]|nr:TonB-dependent receptor [Bacteroidales bacterium]
MKKRHTIHIKSLSIAGLIFFTFTVMGQQPRQTIKGVVRDVDSHITLPGAMVIIEGSEPVKGAVTDTEGNFRLEGVNVGRYNLRVTYIGYEPAIVSEVLVLSGKETVLQIGLKEAVTTLEGVEIKAYSNKERPINPMAMISARQMTMEEASRYAGGIDDPAHLATAYAGVAGSVSSNAIVIRGNAPKGLLWRMEGIEIPNPSHFANVTTFGGGGITALSSQMMSNSDFYTGAFPAEYGNALSGVFDMKLRTGNNEKHEHTLKVGLIGIDFASEGPFIKGKQSSYLINYRYSTLALISPLLPANAQGIKYQDLSFKMNFVLGSYGTISAWGLFSGDRTAGKVKTDSAQWQYYQDIEKDENINRMGAMGINHKLVLNSGTYFNTALAITGNYLSWFRDELNDGMELYPKDEIVQNDRKYAFSFLVNHKFGPRHTNRTGFVLNVLTYNLNTKQFAVTSQMLETFAKGEGGSELLQFYTQSRWNVTSRALINAGLHLQHFTLNKETSIEPRAGISWKLNSKNTFSIAYGLHSRLEPIGFYFAEQQLTGGRVYPNKSLELAKAHHAVLSYELSTGEYSRLRIEPFYQWLFDIPVIPGTSFSMINLEMDWFFRDSLINSGTGRNVGMDITLERFLHNGYYYLFTASLFDSKYTGDDDIVRHTRFNRQYVFNFLVGKEWIMGKEKGNSLGVNTKFSLLGGNRFSPVNPTASLAAEDVVYDETRAFTMRHPPVYYLDLALTWQRNKSRYASTWSVHFVNLLFQKEFYGHRYNFRSQSVEEYKQIAVIPNISYRIDF